MDLVNGGVSKKGMGDRKLEWSKLIENQVRLLKETFRLFFQNKRLDKKCGSVRSGQLLLSTHCIQLINTGTLIKRNTQLIAMINVQVNELRV
ncbi:unnamed protein product [Acanthoscelides obtectus]|uniref:Uncharacterized protein n=1 Tax=Acanthoscelides obtectus TaxID=200917 RepID=A0A9P0KA25_ACAOB|nr:unnamed protein product [Acanthoscelides obtectus]CAK1660924.1 hypothetical protein AOBTE_LOCUS22337 [Acanthoscelides obtectus]